MAFHLGAYAATTGFTANVYNPMSAAGLNETQIQISNNRLLTSVPMNLVAAFAISAPSLSPITAMRVSTPQTRKIANIQLVPTATTVGAVGVFTVPSNPNVAALTNINLARQEEILVEGMVGNIGSPTPVIYTFLGLQDQLQPVPAGPRYWVRFSGSYSAPGSVQWQAASSFAFEDTLAAGMYAVIGMEVQLKSCLAARLIFDNQVFRPGCVGTEAAGQRTAAMFYDGSLGEWGRFDSYSPPRLEIFTVGTSSTGYQGSLYVVALGTGQNNGSPARP